MTPDQILHYRLEKKLGKGGMGEVFLATDTHLDRKVALKFLPENTAGDPLARKRLIREAKAASSLNHPSIVTVFAVEHAEGRHFIVMEYIEGQSLREYGDSWDLSLHEILQLAIQVGDGLEEAHTAGIVHRDIKPSNILIDSKGRARILDFGLAKVEGATKLTESGSTVGTLAYSSPEQTENRRIDHRSDIFSFGVVLYELIAGRLPFQGDHEAAIVYSIVNEQPEPLARYKSAVPDDLQRVTSKLLEKDPELRYQSAAEVVSDLKLLRRGSDPDVPSPRSVTSATGGRSTQPASRRRLGILVATTLAAALILALVFKPWRVVIESTQEAAAADDRLAVMYFDNLADPEDSQRWSQIVTNLLITDMSESQYYKVVSSQRLYDIVKLLGGEGATTIDRNVAAQVAEKAQARWMLLGSILQSDPQIVISAQLVDVATGNVLASERVTGHSGDKIFSVVDGLSVRIREGLPLPGEARDEPQPLVADLTSNSEEAYRHYLKGLGYYRVQFDPETRLKARESFDKALQIDSAFAMAHYYKAWFALTDDERTEAMESAVRHLNQASSTERLYILALSARFKGDADTALRHLRAIIADYPGESEAHRQIAFIYRDLLGDHQAAANALMKSVELDPTLGYVYNDLAYRYAALGDFEKAEWAANKYVEVAPDEANPYDTQGEMYVFAGKLDDAEKSFLKALKIAPDYSLALRNVIRVCMFKRDYTRIDSLLNILASSPNVFVRGQHRIDLSRFYILQGGFHQAIRFLARAAETDRSELGWSMFPAVKVLMRGRIYELGFGDLDSARSVYELAVSVGNSSDPHHSLNAVLLGHLARVNASIGDYSAASQQLQRMDEVLKEAEPPHVAARESSYWRGHVEMQLGHMDTAVALFERAYALSPPIDSWLFRYALARAYVRVGRLGEAIPMFEGALVQYGASRAAWPILSVMLHYRLGVAYEDFGQHDKAIEQYRTFLDIWKNADQIIVEIEDARRRMARLDR